MRALTSLLLCASMGILAGCGDDQLTRVAPDLLVEQNRLDFGIRRVGTEANGTVRLRSRSLAAVAIQALDIVDDPDAPGGAAAFVVSDPVTGVESEAEATVGLRFTPPAVGDFSALLVIASNDPEKGEQRVKLVGRGGLPKIRLIPSCEPPCAGFTVTEDPPAIDFGERPALRRDGNGRILNEPTWPQVLIVNDGEVELLLSRVAFEGDAAFNSPVPLDVEGVRIDQGGGQVLPVRFDPQAAKESHAAELVVVSDDPDQSEIRVALTGKKAPNAAPNVCAAIVKVDQPDGSEEFPLDGSGQRAFGGSVSVQPASTVFLSPFSDHFAVRDPIKDGDPSLCTTDLEEGRGPLKFQWSVEERPRESKAVIQGERNPTPSFKPDAIGRYKLRLQVEDSDGAVGQAFVEFEAIPKRDLVVQLTWENHSGVDLDVHLVRPCSDGSCVFDLDADVNGYSWARRGGVFDWGMNGVEDDPRLDIDDLGATALIENVNLNFPENDPECRKPGVDECVYDVYVHYFKDGRDWSRAQTCSGSGCRQGDVCNCTASDTVCVSARCVTPVAPEVKIYVKPTPDNPAPALTVPLHPEQVELGGPCFMWHVARVHWPSKAIVASDPDYASRVRVEPVGTAGNRSIRYFGNLPRGAVECAPNGSPGGEPTFLEVDWADRPEYP